MAGIKVVRKREESLYHRVSVVVKDKRFIAIMIVLIIGLSLSLLSQEYHPTIYTNFGSYQVKAVSGNHNQTFSFTTVNKYTTTVKVSFQAGNSVRYYLLVNDSHTLNSVEYYVYYPVRSGQVNQSFEFNETSPTGLSYRYALNITSANGEAFPVKVSNVLVEPNKAPSNPYITTSGLVLTIGSLISMAVYVTLVSTGLKGKMH